MAVQKSRKTPSRRGMRRSHDGLKHSALSVDQTTGETHLRHHVSPDGKWALVTDVSRVGEMRRSYGYTAIPDPNRDEMAPDDSGLWLMNMDTGETKLLISIAQVAEIPYRGQSPDDKHYFNHIQWSPDGKRFLFLNRGRWVSTRMFTAAADGSDLRLVNLKS